MNHFLYGDLLWNNFTSQYSCKVSLPPLIQLLPMCSSCFYFKLPGSTGTQTKLNICNLISTCGGIFELINYSQPKGRHNIAATLVTLQKLGCVVTLQQEKSECKIWNLCNFFLCIIHTEITMKEIQYYLMIFCNTTMNPKFRSNQHVH